MCPAGPERWGPAAAAGIVFTGAVFAVAAARTI